jgi:hypothetical protein
VDVGRPKATATVSMRPKIVELEERVRIVNLFLDDSFTAGWQNTTARFRAPKKNARHRSQAFA